MSKYSTCKKCGEQKELSMFHKHPTNKTGIRSSCKVCDYVNDKERRQSAYYKNYRKGKSKQYNIKSKYGLTQEQYLGMLTKQNSKCAICYSETELVVDHCHKTGVVRGLLCFKCNLGLGHFDDNKTILTNAINYLGET